MRIASAKRYGPIVLMGLVGASSALGQAMEGAASYRKAAETREGNPARGREIFEAKDRVGCASCHTVDGKGGKAGPDLAAVGDAFGRSDIIDAILEPSARIAVGYGATSIEMKSGVTYGGVIKESDATQIGLVGADGVLVRLAIKDIKAQTPLSISLMPPGLFLALTTQEFTDLVQYLTTLKQPAHLLTSNHGMPDNIPVLARPVALRPAFEASLRFPSSYVKKPGDIRTGLIWYGQIPGTKSYLAAEQKGILTRLDEQGDGTHRKSTVIDLSHEIYYQRGPNGLLGVAFHPQFLANRKYYLTYQVFEDGKIFTTLVERKMAEDLTKDSGVSSRQLLKIPTVTENHTGACVEFGPDGYLYFGMGDTGPQRDPNGHAQNTGMLLGKIIRIDVDHRDPGMEYAIPADNPLRGVPGARPEIYAWGLREPWRISFDRSTGDLWVGDVGQDRVEEVTIVRRGENHGWNVYEGFEPFSNQYRKPDQVFTPPVMAYKRKYGNSVIGGYVYRGDKSSDFYGVYIFGDYTSKKIWGLTQENRVLTDVEQIAASPEPISSFATDEAGRIYVVTYEGMVYEMDFASTSFPRHRATAPNGVETVTP